MVDEGMIKEILREVSTLEDTEYATSKECCYGPRD